MKIFNKVLNIILIILIVYLLLFISFSVFSPLMYNENSIGKDIKDEFNINDINLIVYKYIGYYQNEDVDSLVECNAWLKRKDKEVYSAVVNNISKNIREIELHDVKKDFDNVYIVQYSFNTDSYEHIDDEPKINKLILKVDNQRKKFYIYYDSLLDRI